MLHKRSRGGQKTVGLRPIKTEPREIDVGSSGAFSSHSSDIPARKGLPDLGMLVEFGLRMHWNLSSTPDTAPGNKAGIGRLPTDIASRGVFDLGDGCKDEVIVIASRLSARLTRTPSPNLRISGCTRSTVGLGLTRVLARSTAASTD